MYFNGKVALVTGASSGIGRATALALARAGAIVLASARRESRLEALVDECVQFSPRSSYIAGDIGQREFAESLVAQAIERYGRLDILVNNAAVPLHRPLYRISADEAEAVMRVNFLSCLWTCFAAIPHMLQQDGGRSAAQAGDAGTIVNVSSFAATVTPTHETIYAASKGAINGFTQGLWNDLAGSGIHALLVVPGPIDTEIWDKFEDDQAYSGKKYPAELVAKEILQAVVKRRFEVTVPRRNLQLVSARLFATLLPSLVRKGVARMSPVDPEEVKQARLLASEGKELGE